MKNKAGFIISMVILILLAGLILLGAYWLLWPYDILKDTGLKVLNQPYSGDDIRLQFKFEKTKDIIGQATVKLINEYIVTLVEVDATQAAGKYSKQLVYSIPENVPPGQYKIKLTIHYRVNPLRTVFENIESELFMMR